MTDKIKFPCGMWRHPLTSDLEGPAAHVRMEPDLPISPDRARKILEGTKGGLVIHARQGSNGWAHLVIAVSPELQARGISAGRLADEGAFLLGARGGGRPDVAQCAGPLGERLQGVINHLIWQVHSGIMIDGDRAQNG